MKTEVVLHQFSTAVNMPVLQLPTRKFPGVLLQGDTLQSMLARVRTARTSRHEEAAEALEDLEGHLAAILAHYESVLAAEGIPLPYSASRQA